MVFLICGEYLSSRFSEKRAQLVIRDSASLNCLAERLENIVERALAAYVFIEELLYITLCVTTVRPGLLSSSDSTSGSRSSVIVIGRLRRSLNIHTML